MSIVRLSTEKLNKTKSPFKKRDLTYASHEDNLRITPEMFKEICPALIVQIDGHECEMEEENSFTNYTLTQGNLANCVEI